MLGIRRIVAIIFTVALFTFLARHQWSITKCHAHFPQPRFRARGFIKIPVLCLYGNLQLLYCADQISAPKICFANSAVLRQFLVLFFISFGCQFKQSGVILNILQALI